MTKLIDNDQNNWNDWNDMINWDDQIDWDVWINGINSQLNKQFNDDEVDC